MRVCTLTPAYVLHARAYRETSLLMDLFSLHNGRLTVIARGARRPSSRTKAILQPFTKLLITVVGKAELKTLTQCEAAQAPHPIRAGALVSGLYLNEVMMRLLPVYDAMPVLFSAYEACLTHLAATQDPEPSLRQFEFRLLAELGYAVELDHDHQGQAIASEQSYEYAINRGFVLAPVHGPYSGASLLAIARKDWDNQDARKVAKKLTRLLLSNLLGQRPLRSRACYYHEVKND